jgi:hypothetical protein
MPANTGRRSSQSAGRSSALGAPSGKESRQPRLVPALQDQNAARRAGAAFAGRRPANCAARAIPMLESKQHCGGVQSGVGNRDDC